MGFKAWHNLGVLLLAGAALVGCNSTPQKKEVVSKGPEQQKLPSGQANNMPGPNFPNTGTPNGAFPRVDPNPNALNNQQKSPWPDGPAVSPVGAGNLNQPAFPNGVAPAGPPSFPAPGNFSAPAGPANQSPVRNNASPGPYPDLGTAPGTGSFGTERAIPAPPNGIPTRPDAFK
jgi:hypothetical protein